MALLGIYAFLISRLNTTTVTIGDGLLRRRDSPLPAVGLDVRVSTIERVYCKAAPPRRDKKRVEDRFSVYAKLRDGKKVAILLSVGEMPRAMSIARALNVALELPPSLPVAAAAPALPVSSQSSAHIT